MTYCTMTAVAVKEAMRLVPIKSVWDFGNQRFTAQGHGEFASTGDFYRSMGVEYRALDINTEMEADIADLNYPVNMTPRDMVVNNGTSEHLFHQASVFANAHRLALKAMLHVVPFTPWWNHGFYNYNPNLFRDLAATNSYDLMFQWIGNRNGQYVDITKCEYGYDGKMAASLGERIESVPPATGYFVISLLGKTDTTTPALRYPVQGRYLRDLATEELRNAYARA